MWSSVGYDRHKDVSAGYLQITFVFLWNNNKNRLCPVVLRRTTSISISPSWRWAGEWPWGPQCAPCCCIPPQSSQAPAESVCPVGRSSSSRTPSMARRICRSLFFCREATSSQSAAVVSWQASEISSRLGQLPPCTATSATDTSRCGGKEHMIEWILIRNKIPHYFT